jgi:hypothetical protein
MQGHRSLVAAIVLAGALVLPGAAFAQDLGNAVANAIINSINRATINRASQSWDAVDKDVQTCLTTQHNLDISQLIQSGIGAADRRVRDPVAACNQFVAQQRVISQQQEQQRVEAEQAAAALAAEQAQRAEADRDARRQQLVTRYGATTANAILSGHVLVGMNREQVLAARGEPNRREQLTPTDEMWHYGGERVVFANGRVTFVR